MFTDVEVGGLALNNGYPVLNIVQPSYSSPNTEYTDTKDTENKTANPTSSTVLVNGTRIAFRAYNIDGSNYFKPRDLAKALNGTAKQFEVGWDGEKNVITITSGESYTPVGGELSVSDDQNSTDATFSPSAIYFNGTNIQFEVYTINGFNYFKLRDIASALDFGVLWDENTQTIGIDTATGYTE